MYRTYLGTITLPEQDALSLLREIECEALGSYDDPHWKRVYFVDTQEPLPEWLRLRLEYHLGRGNLTGYVASTPLMDTEQRRALEERVERSPKKTLRVARDHHTDGYRLSHGQIALPTKWTLFVWDGRWFYGDSFDELVEHVEQYRVSLADIPASAWVEE